MTDLKPLSADAVPAALDKAVRYRLLNEPLQAESICLDVLAVDGDNQEALVTLVLALTDQFRNRLRTAFAEAEEAAARLDDAYRRRYYRGIIYERRGEAHRLTGGPGAGRVAYVWYRRAMETYEEAAELRPPGNDDPILRWNTCARILARHRDLKPPREDSFVPLLE